MNLVDYTSFDDIRAALGVAELELKDTTLSLSLYGNNLASEFDQIDPTLTTVFVALPAAGSQTAEEKSFALYVQLFATYAVAKQLTVSLPLFSPKEIGDGKATMTRYAVDPYKATINGINVQYESFKSKLAAAFDAVSLVTADVVAPRPYMTVVSPSSDPVTGT